MLLANFAGYDTFIMLVQHSRVMSRMDYLLSLSFSTSDFTTSL